MPLDLLLLGDMNTLLLERNPYPSDRRSGATQAIINYTVLSIQKIVSIRESTQIYEEIPNPHGQTAASRVFPNVHGLIYPRSSLKRHLTLPSHVKEPKTEAMTTLIPSLPIVIHARLTIAFCQLSLISIKYVLRPMMLWLCLSSPFRIISGIFSRFTKQTSMSSAASG
jgi:hypothetical protein